MFNDIEVYANLLVHNLQALCNNVIEKFHQEMQGTGYCRCFHKEGVETPLEDNIYMIK
jgi:hypothetical protein